MQTQHVVAGSLLRGSIQSLSRKCVLSVGKSDAKSVREMAKIQRDEPPAA